MSTTSFARAYFFVGVSPFQIWTAKRLGANNWAPATLFYDPATNPPAGFVNSGLTSLSAGAITADLAAKQGPLLGITGVSEFTQEFSVENNTTVPAPVDLANHPTSVSSATGNVAQGDFWAHGAWWNITQINIQQGAPPPPPPNPTTRVYKSIDNRLTWVGQDTANEPAVPPSAVFWDGVSDLITAIISDGAFDPTYSVQEFDLSTGTWRAPHDPINLTPGFSTSIFINGLAVLPNGDVSLFYSHSGPNFTDLVQATLSGGIWNTAVVTVNPVPAGTANNSPIFEQALVDPNGTRIHTFYSQDNVLYYQAVDGGVLGSFHQFTQPGSRDVGHGIILNGDTILVGFSGAGAVPLALAGTPLDNPVWTAETISTTGAIVFIVFDPGTPLGQVVFQGVRRIAGFKPKLIPDYPYCPKTFTYRMQTRLTTANTSTVPVILYQTILNYDFDLEQLILTYLNAAAELPRIVCAVMLYDAVKQQLANIPPYDIFWNGAPGSDYKQGAIVVPLEYPQLSQIRVDLFNLAPTRLLPIDVTVHLVGKQRIPSP